MAEVKFRYGSKTNYEALETKDANTLYFLTDTLQLFKGTKEYTKSWTMVSSLPTTGQTQGIIYIRTVDFTLHIWNGTEYIQLSKSVVTKIPENNSSDDNIPTTKAVADYVDGKISEITDIQGKFVTDVTYKEGVLSVSKNGEAIATTMTGVVHTPTYDAETRTIKMEIFGGDELTIALGKDAFVKSGTYDATKKTIELTLTNDDQISIPVGSLIDIYTGLATPTTETNVSSDNKISVKVKVSAKANNSITVEEDGIYVSVPDAYTKIEIDEKLKAINSQVGDHINDTDIHITAAERADWNAKASVDMVNNAKSEAISVAAADATTKATNALSAAKAHADDLNTAMDTRMTVVEESVTWKEI